MYVLGAEYDRENDIYTYYFRSASGYKDYMLVYKGHKMQDIFMQCRAMTWDEYNSLPDLDVVLEPK